MTSSCRIHITDGLIKLEIPSSLEYGHPHTLTFEDGDIGWGRVKAILRSRQPSMKLGEAGAPTQAQTINIKYDEAKVRKPKPTFSPALRESAKEVLRKLGMI